MDIKFGEYLKSIRIEKSLSARKLSQISGVSQSYITNMENNKRGIPSHSVLKRLALSLGVNPFEFMEASGYFENEDPDGKKNVRSSERIQHSAHAFIEKKLRSMATDDGFFYEHLRKGIFSIFKGRMDGELVGLDYYEFDQSYEDDNNNELDYDKYYNLQTIAKSIFINGSERWNWDVIQKLGNLHPGKHDVTFYLPDESEQINTLCYKGQTFELSHEEAELLKQNLETYRSLKNK